MLHKQRDRKTSPSFSSDRPVVNLRQRSSCYHCRSSNHLAYKPSCLAIKAECNSCGKIGNFAKAYRSWQKQLREIVILVQSSLYFTWMILFMNDIVSRRSSFLTRAHQYPYCSRAFTLNIFLHAPSIQQKIVKLVKLFSYSKETVSPQMSAMMETVMLFL